MTAAGEAPAKPRGEMPHLSLRDRLAGVRDRWLTDPSFIPRAGGTLLGRVIARHEARALFDVTAGFVYAQVLQAALRLRLLETLREQPLDVAALARRLDLPERSTELLLIAAEPLKLVERRSAERWGLGRRGAAVLGNPGIAAMVRHHALLYGELADPVALLRRGAGTDMRAFWPYAGSEAPDRIEAESVGEYSRLMAASQHFIAANVLDAYDFGRHRHLVDVGGGEGVFALAAAARHPALTITVFDLPPVAALAGERFAGASASARLQAAGGDFRAGPLPQGADAMSLVRILHDHDDDAALAILKNVARALPPGGTVVVAEPMAGSPAAPGIAAYFAFYLLAMGSGRPRTAKEITHLLAAAGFSATRCLADRNPVAASVITATVDK